MTAPSSSTPVDEVLALAQPRSAFGRERARTLEQELGEASWQDARTAEAANPESTPERPVRALELPQVFGPAPDEDMLALLGNDASWEVRAASTYLLGLKTSESARSALAARLADANPFVQRRAAEALVRTGITPAVDAPFDPVADVFPLLASPDRSLVRSTRRTGAP